MSKTTTTTPPQSNAGQSHKVFNSAIYRRKIKKMVEMYKNVNGIHTRIPRGDLPKLQETATGQQKSDRALKNALRMNIDTLHYFAYPITGSRMAEVATPPVPENTAAQ